MVHLPAFAMLDDTRGISRDPNGHIMFNARLLPCETAEAESDLGDDDGEWVPLLFPGPEPNSNHQLAIIDQYDQWYELNIFQISPVLYRDNQSL